MSSAQAGERVAVRSMTGYAQVRRQTSAGELTFSLRSVNHRGLDLHFYLGQEFGSWEDELRTLLKSGIARGHVEVRANLVRTPETAANGYDRESLRVYVETFRKAAQEFGLDGKPDLNWWLSQAGSAGDKSGHEPLTPEFGKELIAAAAECLAAFNTTREREGRALQSEIAARVAEMERQTEEMTGVRDEAVPHLQQRLRDKLAELLGTAVISESRVAEEAALLASRSDIQEELTRLAVHTVELRRMVEGGGELGKRLDFLLQELNRETNTALSKSTNAGEPGLRLTNLGLTTKATIERIREQGLNLE